MFRLELETDNAAFGDTHGERCDEIARILLSLAERVGSAAELSGTVRDTNGNTVGRWSITDQE